MNLLGRKGYEQVIRWEPFATSTPLKSISVNPKAKCESNTIKPVVSGPDNNQKVFDVSKIFESKQSVGSKITTSGKNRSKAYFDLSSSSDDENDDRAVEKTRPIIKIGTEDSDKVHSIGANGKRNPRVKVTENRPGIQKIQRKKPQNNKCKNPRRSDRIAEISNSNLDIVGLGASKKINLPASVSSLNPKNNKPLSMTVKFLQSSEREEKQIDELIHKKSLLEVSNENYKKVESSQKLSKRRGAINKNTVYVKKRRQMQMVFTENQSIPVEKCNSSHQLFTDSTQEELINTLHLTTPEKNEFDIDVGLHKVIQKPVIKSKKNQLRHAGPREIEIVEEIASAVEKQERPRRTRQAPKEYWVINDQSKPLKDKTKDTKLHRKKMVTSARKCELVPPVNNPIPSHALNAETGKKLSPTQNTSESIEVPTAQNYLIRKQGIEKLDSMPETKGQSDLGTKNDEVPENISEHLVFLPLNEISYLENEFGHQVSQVCSMKNFKCGIFKLKPGSSFTWEKSQRSNYMGGVLIKGEMEMTVGGSKHMLHEGDMVLVPPWNECQASNTGECDFIFYYWCRKVTK